MTNRIIDLEKRGVPWKKFYNTNFPARGLLKTGVRMVCLQQQAGNRKPPAC